MFEDADRAPGVTPLHETAPGDPESSTVPAVPALWDAQAIIALRECLTGMVPAASAAALRSSTAPAASPATPAGRFGPSQEELAIVTREAESIHRIRALEDLKAACAAAQARETAALHAHRVLDEAARGIPASRRGRGLGTEIGLARRQNPHRGSTHLRQALNLTQHLPNTLTALQTGQITEEHAATLERHTHWLPAPARHRVDTTLADRLPGLSLRDLTHHTQAEAHRQDPHTAAERYDQAVTDRHVHLKPTDHGMAYLTALLPAFEAAACYHALTDQAATTLALGEAEGRSPKQVLSDVLVERLTGRTTQAPSPVEIHLIMTDTTLLAGDHEPAWIPGHGPLPATTARKLLTPDPQHPEAPQDTEDPEAPEDAEAAEARVFLRRLYTSPETGHLVAMDSQRREFPRKLRQMIMIRDNLCRTPYCGAPIRHIDHATPYRDGGPTSYANGSELCERCSYTKEHPDWTHQTTPHHLDITTPTGHHYTSHPRPLTPPRAPVAPATADPRVTPHAAEPRSGMVEGNAQGRTSGSGSAPDQRSVPCTTDTAPVTVRVTAKPPPPTSGRTTGNPAGQYRPAAPSDPAGQPSPADQVRRAPHLRPRARHRRIDLAWSRSRSGNPGSRGAPLARVEYARAA
ncbi:DUF222 domain-containing protein [Citricoccus nitrophenolicus]|uniref:DUF222 domain-containing protein n=1 Tax=Citricoccus nitrophenolicus TaxID=863575 RepID=A0ABV0IHE8_9MICC